MNVICVLKTPTNSLRTLEIYKQEIRIGHVIADYEEDPKLIIYESFTSLTFTDLAIIQDCWNNLAEWP